MQDPLQIQPPRATHPNWKCENFLNHVLSVSMEAWDCGEWISVDEQTIGFQGRHPDKLRITYKNEGDGFQCDAISDMGYTYSFYFRNQPPPPINTSKQDTHPCIHVCVGFLIVSNRNDTRLGWITFTCWQKFVTSVLVIPKKFTFMGWLERAAKDYQATSSKKKC